MTLGTGNGADGADGVGDGAVSRDLGRGGGGGEGVELVLGSAFALSFFFVFGSFLDFVTRDFGAVVRFRLIGSRPSMVERNLEYLMRAAWPLVIS